MQPSNPNKPPKYTNADIFRKLSGGGQQNEHIDFNQRDTSWRSLGLQLGLIVLIVAVLAVAYFLY